MSHKIAYDYNSDLDILHVYNDNINQGIKGCLTTGYFNVDIGNDDLVVGVEIEGASKILNLNKVILNELDKVSLITKNFGNTLFIGVNVTKGLQNSFVNFNISAQSPKMMIAN